MKASGAILLMVIALMFVLVSSARDGEKLRGGPSGDDDPIREAQLATDDPIREAQFVTSFLSFLSFLQSLFGNIAALAVSVLTGAFQFLLAVLFSIWEFLFGAFLSVSSPFATSTTTSTVISETTSGTSPASTSALFSTSATTSIPVTSTSIMSAATSTTTPISTSTTSTSTSTTSASTSTTSASTSTTSASTSTTSASTSTTSASTSTTSASTSTTSMTPTTTQPGPKTVFVTCQQFNGVGGLEGGDAKCNDAAQAENLTGRYLAWLSNATESPNTRFFRSAGPYVMLDGTTIANNYAGLVSGTLLSNINIQEDNVTLTGDSNIWTGTDQFGNATGVDCDDWTSDNSGMGQFGLSSMQDSQWTVFSMKGCFSFSRLYCFEQ